MPCAAGVSKGTLYAYFTSKDELFEAIIRAEYAQSAERLCTFKREGDARSMLTDFGVRLILRMSEPSHMSLAQRVVIAAVEKFPNIGRTFLNRARSSAPPPPRGNELQPSGGGPGALTIPDPERAAWQFVDLCQSYVYKRLLFGVVESLSPEDIEASVKAGVEVFSRAYGGLKPVQDGKFTTTDCVREAPFLTDAVRSALFNSDRCNRSDT